MIYADTYSRLSREEEHKVGESQSIENQKLIMRQYCKSHNIIIVNEFVDDGYSGATFNRPGFQSMLKHLETGAASMVITKDLSRLGRNMSEASYYAEEYFPEHGICYIAISDNFNSEDVSPMSSFLFAYNEFFLKDTSKKIRTALKAKKESGEYCCCPPYGYMKDPAKRGHLVPNPETAPAVRRMFQLVSDGTSARAAAMQLTEEGYITPSVYFYRNSSKNYRASPEWNATTVQRMVQNETYIGNTILGKTIKVSYKSAKKRQVPKNEQICHPNTHVPLVTKEMFDAANRNIGFNTKDWRKGAHLPVRHNVFSGLVFCSKCGSAMCSGGGQYKGTNQRYWYLCCTHITNKKKRCEGGARIKYDDLYQIVKNELNELLSMNDDEMEEMVRAAIDRASVKTDYFSSGEYYESLKKKQQVIVQSMQKVYNDFVAGSIVQDLHNTLIERLKQDYEKVQAEIDSCDNQQEQNEDIEDSYRKFFSMLKCVTSIDELTPELVRTFIQRIEISPYVLPDGYQVARSTVPRSQKIKIYYRFIGDCGVSDVANTSEI